MYILNKALIYAIVVDTWRLISNMMLYFVRFYKIHT